MTGNWIARQLENNEIVSFKTILIPLRERKICKILSAVIIKLNAILTSKFLLVRLNNTFLAIT